MRRIGVLMVVALVLGLAFQVPGTQSAQAEFVKLFNGKDMTGFHFEPPALKDAIRVEDGVIIVPGKPNGYFYTEKSYRNYVLRFDWRYKRPANLEAGQDEKFPGNSGLLVHIQPPHRVWPRCVEVQGMNRDHGNIFAIGGAKGKFKKYADAQRKAIKPVGEWNTTEVTSKDGYLSSKVNGELVSEGEGELKEGPIGWQSEGAEIHFRNIEIKVLP
ncbi:MAG: DUF1080 domain-containing protein [Gemmatales bacterium]|nr:DUF1080 domain-containing protein [Gemmatales bacterium]MDW8224104.1 DUF1080 domain-containing protein [Gemmatales bacterium]